MSTEIKGVIKVIWDTEVISDKFKKREIVITEPDDKYPQHVSYQVTQDRCDLLDGLSVGQEVQFNYNRRGREWTNPKDGLVKYFNTLEIWKIEAIGEAPSGNFDDDLGF